MKLSSLSCALSKGVTLRSERKTNRWLSSLNTKQLMAAAKLINERTKSSGKKNATDAADASAPTGTTEGKQV
jgi:hypothetical protein